jgi:hypothetical protein
LSEQQSLGQKISASAQPRLGDQKTSVETVAFAKTGSTSTAGMQFFAPKMPSNLDPRLAQHVLEGRIHVAIEELSRGTGDKAKSDEMTTVLGFLYAVGSAVPIPKALVSNPLKERLNSPSFKSPAAGASVSIPREVRS